MHTIISDLEDAKSTYFDSRMSQATFLERQKNFERDLQEAPMC